LHIIESIRDIDDSHDLSILKIDDGSIRVKRRIHNVDFLSLLIIIINIFSIGLDDFRFFYSCFLHIGLGIICSRRSYARLRR